MATDKLAAELLAMVSGGCGEFLIEWPGGVHISIDEDGTVGYAILRDGKYDAGKFNIREQPAEAAEEIRAAVEAASQSTISALEAENKRLREALTHQREALAQLMLRLSLATGHGEQGSPT